MSPRIGPVAGTSPILLAACLLSAACGGGRQDGAPGRTSGSARLLRPSSPAHHEIRIELELRGRPGDLVEAALEVSTDGGKTFLPIDVEPAGPYLLAESREILTVTWDSFPVLGEGRFEALLRLSGVGGPRRRLTIANYGFATTQELADWIRRGADPAEMTVADAWSYEHWASGHLEGAICVPVAGLLAPGAEGLLPSRSPPLVFYCGGGT